jgi:hypothetical protein
VRVGFPAYSEFLDDFECFLGSLLSILLIIVANQNPTNQDLRLMLIQTMIFRNSTQTLSRPNRHSKLRVSPTLKMDE